MEASRSGGGSVSTFCTVAVSSRVTNRRLVRGYLKGSCRGVRVVVSLPAVCLCTIIPFVKEQGAGVGLEQVKGSKKREEKTQKC
ncbi:hypothetical protein PbDSM24746_08770 [Paenibacillus macerans]|nr:hypothetical protein PbDSM24746_08770 [Paenibacillus macerans]GBK67174.1 hypothetical protein PbJCM17693_08820 [Paenibacillus macerans]GIP12930.1 hypothetical protein J1TS5_51000 [Paenibacillus macerans]